MVLRGAEIHLPEIDIPPKKRYISSQAVPGKWRFQVNVNQTQGGTMPTYVILSTLTDKGRKTLKENPERILQVDEEIEKLGVKVKEQYAVMGPYDFVNIVEAPNNDAVMRMSVELGSRGTIQLLSLAATPIEDFIKSIK
jgi:uncharacterized protein with GYD domain